MNPPFTRSELQTQILDLAAADPAFRKRLLADPQATVEELLGFPMPINLKFEVVEETAGKIYMVLPQSSDTGSVPLSEAELDASGVAGGCWFPLWEG